MTPTLLIALAALFGAVFAGALLPPARRVPRLCTFVQSTPR